MSFFLNNPLEQFELLEHKSFLHSGPQYLNYFNSLTLVILVSVLLGGAIIPASLKLIKTSDYLNTIEHHSENTELLITEYDGDSNMYLNELNIENNRHEEKISALFYLVYACNFIGLLPFLNTNTSHFSVTLSFSMICIYGLVLLAIRRHGINILKLFLPAGTPLLLTPLIIALEIISFVARSFSLGIRLFANMMAGHILLKLLIGYVWLIACISGFFGLIAIIPGTLVFAVCLLENAISFLQAYVITVLSVIYLNEIITL